MFYISLPNTQGIKVVLKNKKKDITNKKSTVLVETNVDKKSNDMEFSYDMNNKGSLYQTHILSNTGIINTKNNAQTNETNTISNIFFQQSLSNNTSANNGKSNYLISQNWISIASNSFFDHKKTMVMVEQFVHMEIFYWLKFISSLEMIAFSWSPQSLCQIVCQKFQVDKMEQTRFWLLYSKLISQKLNKKRSEISNIMLKSFRSKLSLIFCVDYFNLINPSSRSI